MSYINGSDLFMWLDDDLVGSSTSYTISIEDSPRPTTNKGSGFMRTYKNGLFDVTVSCDGLVVYDGGVDLIYAAMMARTPVKLDFGEKALGTLTLDNTTRYYTGNFIVSSFEEVARDADNALYSATFKPSDDFGRGVEEVDEWYWIATDGSDDTGDGSYTTPWATLAYACSQVTTPGEIIHVKAGTYTETVQSQLAVGVSIVGAGATSIIKSNYAWSTSWPSTLIATLRLRSASEGTDGNQSISYLKFDGDSLTGTAAICVSARSNVEIHHCEFVDFLTYGVSFTGTVDMSYGEATTYASGNSFHHNTMTNCAVYNSGGRGSLMIGSDEDMEIHNNTFTESLRGGASYPYSIDKLCYGFHKGLKIHDNTMGGVELWYIRGGHEFYNNVMDRAVDYGGIDAVWGNEDINDDGGYGYGARIYDNVIGTDTYPTAWLSGINLEQTILDGVYIYRNIIKRRPVPIMFSPSEDYCNIEDVHIYYNLFYDIGRSGSPLAYGVWLKSTKTGVTCSDIDIWNNVIVSEASPYQYAGVCFGGVTGSNISIRNNIIQGAADYCISFDTGAVLDVVSIENNLFYTNAHADVVYTDAGSTITNKTEQNNITADNPDFVTPQSDYHLQAGSPCINAGIDVGLTTDYDGQAVDDPPEIGAYEY